MVIHAQLSFSSGQGNCLCRSICPLRFSAGLSVWLQEDGSCGNRNLGLARIRNSPDQEGTRDQTAFASGSRQCQASVAVANC